MKISTLTFTMAILLGIGVLTSGPSLKLPTAAAQLEGAGGALLPPVVPEAPKAVEAKPSAAEEADSQAQAAMMEKLEAKIDVDYFETDLASVIQDLGERTKLQLLLDYSAAAQLKEHQESRPAVITLKLNQIPVRRILSIILEPHELTFVPVEDGLVTVTTQEEAASQLVVRVYNCRDILYASKHFLGTQPDTNDASSMGGGGMAMIGAGGMGGMPGMPGASMGGMAGMSGMPGGMGAAPATPGGSGGRPETRQDLRAARLMNLISTTVESDSWNEVGGDGSLSEFDGLIVVNQTAATHQQVEKVLDMLRSAAAKTPKPEPTAVQPY